MENEMSHLSPREIYGKISANIEKVMRGQSEAIRKILAGFASGGHVLLEDYPGQDPRTIN
jgi:MoxR-like ATPase